MTTWRCTLSLGVCVASAVLGGCGLSKYNPFAPVEQRPAPPVVAKAPTRAAPAPKPADAPIRNDNTVIYPQPTLSNRRAEPQPLTAPGSAEVGAPDVQDGASRQSREPGRSISESRPLQGAGGGAGTQIATARPAPAAGGGPIPEPPDNPAARALVAEGQGHQVVGKFEKAAASYERALEIAPADPWLWHRLARVRALQGQKQLARALARRSNALGAGDASLEAANKPML